MRILAFVLLASFTAQVMDIPPARAMPHSKTCCGRSICSCQHAKGALCPLRHKAPRVETSAHKSCHLKKAKVKTAPLPQGPVFASGPCASGVPKMHLPQYAKDFLSVPSTAPPVLIQKEIIPDFSFARPPAFSGRGIEYPPRIF
jgi:hypothetical protein